MQEQTHKLQTRN